MTNTTNRVNPNPGKNPTKVITGIVRMSYF